MRISAEKVLLALLGYLHFRRADGMDLNVLSTERTIVLTMEDECTFDGRVHHAWVVPQFLQQVHENHEDFVFYVPFSRKRQFQGVLRSLLPSSQHDDNLHTPHSVRIHIDKGEYYLSGPFETYSVQQHQSQYFPDNDYIYVAITHRRLYRAPLHGQKGKESVGKLANVVPGITPPKRPRMKDDESHDRYMRMKRRMSHSSGSNYYGDNYD